MHRAFIALGANLEDPAGQLRAALADLAALSGIAQLRPSSLYRTAPMEATGPDYVNAVAEVRTDLPPEALLAQLFAVEARFGRTRSFRNAPRTLDLDLLLHGDTILDTPDLILPHPRLHLRAFVLVPLAELAPDLPLPGRGSVAAWLPAVANQRIEKL